MKKGDANSGTLRAGQYDDWLKADMRCLGPQHHYQEAQEKNKNSMHLRVSKDRTNEGVSTEGLRDEGVLVKAIRDH